MAAAGSSGRAASALTRLDTRDNALNAIRLVLAVLVIVDHSSMIGFGQPDRFTYLGGFAVDAFFAISGYLITGSRVRATTGGFWWRRFLRLMPGYWGALVVTAVLIAPASAALSHLRYDWSDALAYVVHNSLLFTVQGGIGATPSGVTYVGLWNGSVWSLPYEAAAYVLFGLLVALPRFGTKWAAAAGATLAVAISLQQGSAVGMLVAPDALRLWSFFAAGVLMWFLRARLPSSTHAAVAAAAFVACALAFSRIAYLTLAPVPLAYVLLWLGARLPLRIGSRNDISYGMYVFAFPLQQLMAVGRVPEIVGRVGFIALSVIVTVPVAFASWFLVERPCMRLRRLVARPGSSAIPGTQGTAQHHRSRPDRSTPRARGDADLPGPR